jgi:hypothetical protein
MAFGLLATHNLAKTVDQQCHMRFFRPPVPGFLANIQLHAGEAI